MLHRFSIGKQREHAPSEPQVKLYLKKKRFYPGDNLSGVVVVEVYNPFELLTLELKLLGEERSGVGTVLYKRSSYDEKVSLYYLQYVTLLGKNHDEIVHTGTLSQSPSFFRRRSTMTVSQPMTRPSFLGTIPKGDNEEEKEEGEKESKTESSKRRKSKAGNPSMNPEELQQASINISRNMNLMTGTYVIPFQVQLANDLPPTMSIDKGRDAHSTLFYSCQARLISQGGKQYKTTRRFGIQPLPVQLQRWLIIQRAVRESEDPEGTKGGPVRRSEGDAIDNDDTLSRYTTMTLQTNADGKTKSEDDVALNHRLRHNIQLPEELLEEEEEESRSTRKSAKKAKGQLTLDAVEQLDKLNKSKEEDGGDGEDVVAFKEDDEEPEPESTRKSKPRRQTRNSVIPEDLDGESEEPEETKDAKPEEGKEGEETKGSKKDSIITTWEEQFKIPIRSGVLGTSKSVVEVHLVFASIVLVRQRGVLKVKALIDNSEGNSTINKIKYSIVTRGVCRGKGVSSKWSTECCEMIFARSIKKGAIERLDEVEIPLPQDIPLSLFTGGVSTSVHFVCRLFSTAGLTTTSRSAECELLVVNAIDRKNKSVRLRRWTNYFREKNLARRASTAGSASFKEKFEPTARCKDYHNRNKDLLLMDVTEYDGSMEMQVETGKMEQRKSIVVGESDDDMSDRENYVAVRDLHKPQDNPCKEYSRLITLIRRNTNNTNRNKSATFIPRDDDGAVHLDPMSADGFRTSAARRPGDNEYNEDDDEVHPFDQGDANPFASGMAKDDDAKPSYGYNAE